ncbi:MAG: AcrB/AcrD/AcrF family protein [Candidatus Aminicenantes bacterium]|nr:AcrB/AcrD/AcrF family protein [Candidatus Aminicenantes bacterium]NIM78657.1 AcrB/AcrD/AcrF family protein [Candidatus Aminicenantes bacterium]NIN17904.1 AcrB/AcrD/AcrF family protein [Candidatus Aminicenantes bacterium]NIN41807.1 AcrB/AcrD/AcrF family protein [Candidatus Aminicenantes bacterium]NIN84559.1 AcrB/AcrD/AcrF family protein [Candidatus Aminicenantes bacterium]
MREKSDLANNSVVREFRLTTLSLMNRNTVFLVIFLLVVFGIVAYNTMPMELFPEINMPNIFVKTVYPGNPPIDMENLITRPLEKEIHTINGIKELRSVSTQDNSDIFIEFNTNVNIDDALQDVKDAVDKAKSELPNDLDMDPLVMDFDFNEFPIININLSGDYSINELKDYAEYLEDEIESITEISKVEIKGLDNREIQINVDPHKLEAYELSFSDIEDAVNVENVSISGGDLIVDRTSRSIRTVGEFTDIKEIKGIIVKQEDAENIVYLRDVARVADGFEDPLTYARLDRKPVVSLQVVKKAGENLLNATDKIFAMLARAKKGGILPKDLNIFLSNDQSEHVGDMVDNLENNIIMGVLFVVLVLFFFLGLRNALFVGIAIPMSMFISFVVLSLMGYTLNMMVLFGLVLALGMLVDNGIVVVENIYRFVHQGHSLFNAAKTAVGEIAMPIIASTATTLAAFFPLVFWHGIVGEFMKHLPVTLIVVLTSSLFVALVIIPVLASRFFKKEKEVKPPTKKRSFIIVGILLVIAVLSYLAGINALGTFLVFISLLVILNLFFLHAAAEWFQKVFLTKLEAWYLKILRYVLKGKRPAVVLAGTFVLFLLVMMFFGMRTPNVVFFPVNEPGFVNVFAELPIGSDISASNDFMYKLEDKIFEVIKPYESIVESVLTTVGKGVVGQNEFPLGNTPHKGMTTITFVDYEDRGGIKTSIVMKKLSTALLGKYPGVQISVVKDIMGPPTGKPVNIEIIGEDFERLLQLTQDIRKYIENADIKGIEGFKMDLDVGKPELLVTIDRDKARRFGLSTSRIAGTIRTALFGKEVSDFKEGEDEYPIMLRFSKKYRNDISALLNQKITFKSVNTGAIMQVPISSVAGFQYSTTYGSVNRKDMDKVITLWSNIIEGYNPSYINMQLKELMKKYNMPEGYQYKFTGEQEEQEETSAFLMRALFIALALIMLIMVTQFNSFAKPFIIMATVLFSTIGVFGGLATFRMDFVIIMTGIGIISLAGVVVNNGIVLIDYIDFLKLRAKKRLGMGRDDNLPIEESVKCIIQGGRTRLRPVLLTAITTILGLTPMAVGLNINFNTLLSRLDPQIYFGGDNALFWGPMALTVIFGLSFATILTLVVVPAMYVIGNRIKLAYIERFKK